MKKNNPLFSFLQKLGLSFMIPISILPVAGILISLGACFSSAEIVYRYNLGSILSEGTFISGVLLMMKEAGHIIFLNLPLVFAVGVAIGMAEKEKATAAISGLLSYFVMNQTISSLIKINEAYGSVDFPDMSLTNLCGITTLNTGVFGGIIVGIGVAVLHNRFYKIKFPGIISFFGGTRFVPIISTLSCVLIGVALFFIWPPVQNVIYNMGMLVAKSGYIGTLFYGFIEKALMPFGLHHIFYVPFWQTGIGGTAVVDSSYVHGAQNIFFAQLAANKDTHFSVEATRFMSGKFPVMIFGLPGAALAIYTTSKGENKKAIGKTILAAALTSALTGITEPIEFMFLFAAPLLYYGVHCVLSGISYMLMHILNVAVGLTFSGGILDLTLFGIMQGNRRTNWIYILVIGVIYFFLYFILFRLIITKFDSITPGREHGESNNLYKSSGEDVSAFIVEGLGGFKNIKTLDCCATRLRITVYDSDKVNEAVLKKSGPSGIIKRSNSVQIIFGPKVTLIKSSLDDYIDKKNILQ